MALTDNIRFRQGSLAALANQAIANGSLWFTTDEGAIYLDVNGERVRFGDYITVDAIANLPQAGHAYESALYYAKAENVLARWDKTNGKWVQLNAAGLSKIVVNGSGNVLSGATVTVDAETGAKVLTFNTASVATSEELGGLKTRVQTLEGKMTKVEAKLADVAEGETVGGLISAAKTDLQGKIDAVDALADQGIADAAAAKSYAETEIGKTNGAVQGLTTRMGTAEGNIGTLQTDVTNLKNAVGEGGSVEERIEDAIETLTGTSADAAGTVTIHGALNAAAAAQSKADDNASAIQGLNTRLGTAEGDIDNLQAAVELLNKDDQTAGSVDYKIAQEVAKILNDNDASDIDTLQEIASWITNDTTGAASMAKDIADIKQKDQSQDTLISNLTTTVGNNKTAAEQAITNLETKLVGDAENMKTMGALEDAVVAAQTQANKGVADAAAAKSYAEGVQGNVNGLTTRMTTAEGNITNLQGRMDQAEIDIDALELAQSNMDAAYKAADTALEEKLVGDATTYKTFGAAEDAIQGINTQISAINNNLTWDTFQ